MKKSKTKLLLSLILAAVMICVSVVPAFAMTDEEIDKARIELNSYASDCVSEYVQYFQVTPVDVPIWSDASEQRIQDAADKIDSEIYSYKTEEEFATGRAIMDEAVEQLCISSNELKWMLDYLKKDYNSTDYYNQETTARIKSTYEEAQSAYESGTEKEIHIAYINMRNLLDDLCVYNTVPGDVDQSGDLNIIDIALMQLNLAKLNKEVFTSSQNYIANFPHGATIEIVTGWQLEIAKLNTYSPTDNINKELTALSENKGIDVDLKHWFGGVESNNALYFYDRYVWWV